MTSTRASIVIATPCYGGMMSHVYVTSLLKLMVGAPRLGLGLTLHTAAHDSLITRSRNALLKGFLDTPGATHMLFIDADIGFEPEDVERLVALDEEVACGMYPIKSVDWAKMHQTIRGGTFGQMNENDLREAGLHYVGVPLTGAEHREKSRFVAGKYAGTGFMLIKRSAIEKMIAAYPDARYRAMHTLSERSNMPSTDSWFYNFFDCLIEPESGVYLSEDFAFCHRFRAIGGQVWLDTESRLRHVGSAEFQGYAAVEMLKYGAVAQMADAAE